MCPSQFKTWAQYSVQFICYGPSSNHGEQSCYGEQWFPSCRTDLKITRRLKTFSTELSSIQVYPFPNL